MKVTQNVIHDLLPAYLAGEASADTVALVEEFLRLDPELARTAEALRSTPLPEPPHRVTTHTRKGDVEHDETIAVVARNPDGPRDLSDAASPVVPVWRSPNHVDIPARGSSSGDGRWFVGERYSVGAASYMCGGGSRERVSNEVRPVRPRY